VAPELVPYANSEEAIRYRGVNPRPWTGLDKTTQRDTDTITGAANNIARMELKPHQKLELIRVYLLPRYIHGLVAVPPSMGALANIDAEVRRVVKDVYKLHPSTTDGIIYTDRNHGGLGLQRIETIVKLAVLRSAIKQMATDDPALRQLSADQDKRCDSYAKSLGIPWPATLEQVDKARRHSKRRETERWERLTSQGHGVRDFRGDKIGNSWLRNPRLLKPSRYIDAIKLRTNTIGTKVVLNRVSPIDVKCRRCGMQAETLGHILGMCLHTKSKRIRRHDEIKDLVADKLPKGFSTFVEPVVNVAGDLKKPDLVIKHRERLMVVDVTVRYENRTSLADAFREKKRKYKTTADHIAARLGCTTAEVLPIVVGCRGAMPGPTVENLSRLGLKAQDMLTVSMIALRSSIEIVNAFLDYDYIA